MPWKKGQSGNPLGRLPGEKQFADQLRIVLAEPVDKNDPKSVRKMRRIAEKLVECALNGEPWAISQVADRIDGKATAEIQTETDASRPVRWIVGFSPSGSADLHARLIAQWLSERLGQQFIIENRPGASTNIALQAAVNSQPDGHRGGGGDIDHKARRAWRGYGVAHSGPLK
jgi:hypothetical protein